MIQKSFLIQVNERQQLLSLIHPDDPFGMNWVEGDIPWGTVVVSE